MNCILVIKHYTTNAGETKDCIFYAKRSKAEAYIADLPGIPEDAGYDEDDGECPF